MSNWAIINTMKAGAWFSISIENRGLICLGSGVWIGMWVNPERDSGKEVACGCTEVSGATTVTGTDYSKICLLFFLGATVLLWSGGHVTEF